MHVLADFGDLVNSCLEFAKQAAADPQARLETMCGGILAMLFWIGRKKKPGRSRVVIDLPEGESGRVVIGKDEEK